MKKMNEAFKSNSSCTSLKAAPSVSMQKALNYKMSKGIRIQLVDKHIHEFDSKDGTYCLGDILPKDVRPEEVLPIVEKWLDENCSNGHYSTWTGFGTALYAAALLFAGCLAEEYAIFFKA